MAWKHDVSRKYEVALFVNDTYPDITSTTRFKIVHKSEIKKVLFSANVVFLFSSPKSNILLAFLNYFKRSYFSGVSRSKCKLI